MVLCITNSCGWWHGYLIVLGQRLVTGSYIYSWLGLAIYLFMNNDASPQDLKNMHGTKRRCIVWEAFCPSWILSSMDLDSLNHCWVLLCACMDMERERERFALTIYNSPRLDRYSKIFFKIKGSGTPEGISFWDANLQIITLVVFEFFGPPTTKKDILGSLIIAI